MHPYIAQIDDVVKSNGGFFGALKCCPVQKISLSLGVAGMGCAAMWAGFVPLGHILVGLGLLGSAFCLAVSALVALPVFLTLHIDQTEHSEVARNTLHSTAVAWCEHDPRMVEVFAHFAGVFNSASPKIRAQLIFLMLSWKQPNFEHSLSHEDARQRFDKLFPNTVDVESDTLAWRSFSKKYLRI